MPTERDPDRTAAYREESPAGAPERVPVELVGTSGLAASRDLYRLLRWRVLIAALIWAGVMLLASVVRLVGALLDAAGDGGQPFSPLDLVRANWRNETHLVVAAFTAGLLWRRPPATVRGLRAVELSFFGLVTASLVESLLTHPYYQCLELADQQPPELRPVYLAAYYGNRGMNWMLLVALYGALIPNTWRRCAAVTASMAAVMLLAFFVYSTWVQPLPAVIIWSVAVPLGFYVAATVCIVSFASSRIERFRREASEARRLGQYVLRERLGAGGMGEVYRAEHVLLRRPCALKLIRTERASDPTALSRFEREVQTTATLTHPNTVQIFDYGHAADGTFYYVMEYLPGVTLEELVAREGPLPPARALHFLRQICGALREAHGHGLTHRDVKPGNVMACERGGIPDVAKLLDFGLVRPPAAAGVGEKVTQDGTVTGTPAYLSPEQAGGEESVDARSDVYSVGALAYFLLTGQPPFAGRTGVKMLAAHLYEEPAPPSTLQPGLPADLEAVVLRCLAKKPEGRFPDVETLDSALAACQTVGLVAEADGQGARTKRCT